MARETRKIDILWSFRQYVIEFLKMRKMTSPVVTNDVTDPQKKIELQPQHLYRNAHKISYIIGTVISALI